MFEEQKRIVFYLPAVILVSAVLLALSGCLENAKNSKSKYSYSISSPDGNIQLAVNVADQLSYKVIIDQKEAIGKSPLGFEIKGQEPIGKNLRVIKTTKENINKKINTAWGTSSNVKDKCMQMVLSMQEKQSPFRNIDLVGRAYNDGVAFRFVFPEQQTMQNFEIAAENTHFNLVNKPDCWAADFASYHSHQEAKYPKRNWNEITNGTIWGLPMVSKIEDGLYVGILEAALKDYAGMYLAGEKSGYGKKIFNSGEITGSGKIVNCNVSIDGIKTLRIAIEPVDPVYDDRAVLAEAKLVGLDGTVKYLSELEPVSSLKKIQKDKNSDGEKILLAGREYSKGIGSFSRNEIVYQLDGNYKRLSAKIGIDDKSKQRGKIRVDIFGSQKNYTPSSGLVTMLSPYPGTDGKVLVKAKAGHKTPWRVILTGKNAGELIESEMMVKLNEPSRIKDTSWIKPGMMAWDHWWSGELKVDTETNKKYIKFASDVKFPYMLIDWGWYGSHNNPKADVTIVTPKVNMPELLKYAEDNNVKLWVWAYWSDIDRKLEDAFALYEKWGLAGVKIDFMQRDDQQMVNWYHKTCKLAAKHHLMLDFHGAYVNTGLRRTWPNFMTREAVQGNEWNKWRNTITSDHNVTLPFTRMLAGPMDYTPGGFLNVTKDAWKPGSPTKVITTRCHQVAMTVVYESPITCLCDHPDNYYGQKGLEFIKKVPSNWDQTRVLNGEIGEYITLARRNGKKWYLGAMANQKGKSLDLPLDFLGKGKYTAYIFEDGKDATENPASIVERTITVSKENILNINMAPSGGFAAYFVPVK